MKPINLSVKRFGAEKWNEKSDKTKEKEGNLYEAGGF